MLVGRRRQCRGDARRARFARRHARCGWRHDRAVVQHVSEVVEAFAKYPGQIAAVILEPVVGNMGCVPATMEFLNCLREETSRDGAILIFDEVMTGFRLAFGGVQERFGVTPDMTTLGKIVGGGMPLGAYGGRADIMNQVLPAGKVFPSRNAYRQPRRGRRGQRDAADC